MGLLINHLHRLVLQQKKIVADLSHGVVRRVALVSFFFEASTQTPGNIYRTRYERVATAPSTAELLPNRSPIIIP